MASDAPVPPEKLRTVGATIVRPRPTRLALFFLTNPDTRRRIEKVSPKGKTRRNTTTVAVAPFSFDERNNFSLLLSNSLERSGAYESLSFAPGFRRWLHTKRYSLSLWLSFLLWRCLSVSTENKSKKEITACFEPAVIS